MDIEKSMQEAFINTKRMDNGMIRAMNPIVLAYIGDATYEQRVRKQLILRYPKEKINALHKKAVSFAKAASQARVLYALREKQWLTEEEWYFAKRGRNTQSIPPKNADVTDYRYATGFETMVGYLALSNQEERLDELVNMAFEIILGKRQTN